MSVDFRLYLITDRKKAGFPLPEAIEEALKGGVKAIQLREKDLQVKELLELAEKIREITKQYEALLFINDRVDVALAVGADGVHLAGTSMPTKAVRRMLGSRFLIGVSTHSIDEAIRAQSDGADFITFGPVFETESKKKYGPPQGVGRLKEVVEVLKIPVFALGGINEHNIPAVMDTGVYGISMISAILGAEDIEEKTKRIVRLL
jgi:thiamine-phosphate pyrophosphorylase